MVEGLCESFFRTVGGDCEKALVKILEGFEVVGLGVIIERMGVKVDLSMTWLRQWRWWRWKRKTKILQG